jgi:GTP cyclohydrolase I
VAVIPRKNSSNQVARCIQTALKPKGVAILIGAQHQCMTTRGLPKLNVTMLTMRFTGVFRNDPV